MRHTRVVLVAVLALAVPAPAGPVAGRVLDEDGRPLSGVTVTAVAPESLADAARRQLAHASPRALASATTDAAGAFRLEPKEPFGRVRAEAPGFLAVERAAVEELPVTLTLARPPLIRRRLLSEAGPLKGATVVWTGAAGDVERVVASGDDGSFDLPDPREASGWVTVLREGYAALRRMEAEGPMGLAAGEVRLKRGAAVRGTVVDERGQAAVGAEILLDGWPVARTTRGGAFEALLHAGQEWSTLVARTPQAVGLARRGGGGGLRIVLRAPHALTGVVLDARTRRPLAAAEIAVTGPMDARAVTDARGQFQVAGLPAGRYEAAATRPGYGTRRESARRPAVDLRALPSARVELSLEPLRRLAGRVEDAQHRPVEGALVTLGMRDTPAFYVRGGQTFGGTAEASARTGPDGGFVLVEDAPEEVPSPFKGLFENRPFDVLKEGFAAAQAPVAATGPTVITLERGVVLAGRVIDASGQPLAGVAISAAEDGAVAGMMMPTFALLSNAPQQGWTTTGADGRFALHVRPQPHHVAFAARGYSTQVVRAHDPRSGPLDVQLVPAATLRGHVLRPDGRGVPGLNVVASGEGSAQPGFAATDGEGAFEIPGLGAGVYDVNVLDPAAGDAVARTVEVPGEPLEIVLGPVGAVRGQVLEASTLRPVTAFRILQGGREPVDVEDAEGRFLLSDVPAGEVTLSFQAEGHASRDVGPLTVEADGETTAPEVHLEPEARLTGRVTDTSGSPVADAQVTTDGARHEYDEDDDGGPATDENGEFEVRGLAAGKVDLEIAADGYVRARRSVDTRREPRVEIVLERGLSIRGEVVRDGKGIPDAWVGAASESDTHVTVQADAEGRFVLRGLAPGRYTVFAYAQESGRVERKDVDPATSGPVRLVFDTTRGAVITGSVTGLLDEPAGAVMVHAAAADGRSGSALVDASRRFRIDDAPSGHVVVTAWAMPMGSPHGMRTSRPAEIDVAAGAEAEVALEFPSLFTVAGVVTRNGGGVPYANVAFQSAEGQSGTARADGAGAYRLEVPGGAYDVHVSAGTLAYSTRHVVLEDGTFDIDASGGGLRGRVLRADDGSPLAGVEIALYRAGESRSFASLTSSAAGAFQQDYAPEGRYRLVTTKKGFGQQVQEVELQREQVAEIDLQLVPADGVQVRVLDARTRAPLDAIVVVRDAGRNVVANRHGGLGEDGTFVISLADGAYTLSTSAGGYGTATLPIRAPSKGVEVTLTPGGTLVIESAVARHGTVRLRLPSGDEYVRCWCNGIAAIQLTGRRTVVEHVTPATYTVEVDGEPGMAAPTAIVREGGTTTVQLP